MSLHTEINFETEICEHLGANGWLYSEKEAAGFVRDLCLFPEDVLGQRKELKMAQFKSALAMNTDIMTRYAANRLRVVRQVRYSMHNENSIDLVLFLNGNPVATVELKTDFTQNIEDAANQYRFDRDPSPKGRSAEPLLSFPNGALVHFAVSNREVCMTTRLEGTNTLFLPLNKGDDGAAGNPLNPNGHQTAYLWEDVWQRFWKREPGRST